MTRPVNYIENYGRNHCFHKTEVTVAKSGTTTTTIIYDGLCLSDTMQDDTDPVWDIRRTVVTEVEDGPTTSEEKWATGSAAWTDRATLTYKYM